MEEFVIPDNVWCATKIEANGKPAYAMVGIVPDGSQLAVLLFGDLAGAEEYCEEEGYNVLNLGSGKELKAFLKAITQPRVQHAAFDNKSHKAYFIEIKDVISRIKAEE